MIMWKDSVVEEVRAIRDEYARTLNYDIEAICRDLRAQEFRSGREVVALPPKRVVPTGSKPSTEGEAA
jgi:hypothetical protein